MSIMISSDNSLICKNQTQIRNTFATSNISGVYELFTNETKIYYLIFLYN